jgi:hypothetical protein
MNAIYDAFDTDDPDQIADRLVDRVMEILAADRENDHEYTEGLLEEFQQMVRALAGAD